MASKGDKTTGLNLVMALAVVLAMLCAQATAQSGCTSALKGLTPCLSFVTGCSSAPSSSCCSELASLVQSHPQCLHTVLDDVSLSFDVTLNQEKILSGNLALKLPSACIVQTLVSKCNASGGTVDPVGSTESFPSDTSGISMKVPSTAAYSTGHGVAKISYGHGVAQMGHGVAKMPPLRLAVLSVFMATLGYVLPTIVGI